MNRTCADELAILFRKAPASECETSLWRSVDHAEAIIGTDPGSHCEHTNLSGQVSRVGPDGWFRKAVLFQKPTCLKNCASLTLHPNPTVWYGERIGCCRPRGEVHLQSQSVFSLANQTTKKGV